MANQTQILNVSDEMKLNDNVQTKNVKEQEENMYSSSSDTTEELCSSSTTDTCGDCVFTLEEIVSSCGARALLKVVWNNMWEDFMEYLILG